VAHSLDDPDGDCWEMDLQEDGHDEEDQLDPWGDPDEDVLAVAGSVAKAAELHVTHASRRRFRAGWLLVWFLGSCGVLA
jgi:hypothetical protein